MANFTHYHSKYLAHRLTLEGVDDDAFAKSLSTARVDMNPGLALQKWRAIPYNILRRWL